MKTSDTIVKITTAFLKAQKRIKPAKKDSENPFFKSMYADFGAVVDSCRDILNAEGISILQPIDGLNVETILIHESGEWFSSLTPIVSKDANNPQALGSAITYARRYGLQSMVLLPSEDDDGNQASKSLDIPDVSKSISEHYCSTHKIALKDRGQGIWDHRQMLNDMLEYDPKGNWYYCQGAGWHISIPNNGTSGKAIKN